MAAVKHQELEYPESPGSPVPSEDFSVTDSDASIDMEIVAVPEDKRCKYPSKFCGRARARKTNGKFHRFCQYHRIKANTNQKRWTSVRRQQAALEEQQRRRAEAFTAARQLSAAPSFASIYPGAMALTSSWTPGLLPDPVNVHQATGPVGLPLEDVQILSALLTGDEPQTTFAPMNPPRMLPHRYGYF